MHVRIEVLILKPCWFFIFKDKIMVQILYKSFRIILWSVKGKDTKKYEKLSRVETFLTTKLSLAISLVLFHFHIRGFENPFVFFLLHLFNCDQNNLNVFVLSLSLFLFPKCLQEITCLKLKKSSLCRKCESL